MMVGSAGMGDGGGPSSHRINPLGLPREDFHAHFPQPGAAVCLPGRVGGLLMGMDTMRGAGRHGDTPG